MSDILRKAWNACSFEKPLEANSERRVDLHALGVRGHDMDPMTRLRATIQTADTADGYTHQLFSGFIGSGKSTELKRLASDLEQEGYIAILVDSEDYLNLHVPPRANDLVATVGASVDKFIQEKCPGAIPTAFKRYWERVRNFLGSEVEIEGAKINVPGAGELALKLRQEVSLKTRLYEYLEKNGRLSDLAQQCHAFLEEAVAVVEKAYPDRRGIVVIVDSFEKVRGDYANKVQHAVETIFVQDWKLLQLPCHVIYTVPSWLTFLAVGTAAAFGKVWILPMCRLMDQTGQPVPEGFEAMREILKKRMNLADVFSDTQPLDKLIEMSGGYPRDFLRMMQELLLLAIMEKIAPPIPSDRLSKLVEAVIRERIQVYDKPIYDEDLPLLVDVARTHNVPQSERSKAVLIAELFDNHFILGYRNGEEWYDLHPLVKQSPRVQRAIEKANGKQTT